jgi:hypothetical protein
MNELDELIEKNYILHRLDKNKTPTYTLPRAFILSLRKGKPLIPEANKNLTIEKFLQSLSSLFIRRYNDELLFAVLLEDLASLVNNNTHLTFIKKINSYDLNELDRALLLYFCHKHFNCRGETVDFYFIEKQFTDEDKDFDVDSSFINPLKNDNHILQTLGLVEHVNDDGFFSISSFTLTEKTIKEFKDEIGIYKHTKKNKKDLIVSSDITKKEMFYNKAEREKLVKLTELLLPENYKNIENRLGEKGMRKGFACLFSGYPGTGKTETVYQIARQTGRDIMPVDISQIKSCWVGQSEKQIKEVFTLYKKQVNNSDIAPILLFNEADAVIGKRRELNDSSRSYVNRHNITAGLPGYLIYCFRLAGTGVTGKKAGKPFSHSFFTKTVLNIFVIFRQQ